MARKRITEVTSRRAASAASKVLRNPRSSKVAKTAAASALAQSPTVASGRAPYALLLSRAVAVTNLDEEYLSST